MYGIEDRKNFHSQYAYFYCVSYNDDGLVTLMLRKISLRRETNFIVVVDIDGSCCRNKRDILRRQIYRARG